MSWYDDLKSKLKKVAIDKLSSEELDSGLPPPGESGAGGGDPSVDPSQDPAMAGMDPNMGLDPSMMPQMPPMPEPKPKVWDNKYLVQTDQTKFIVELTPSIVLDPTTDPNQMPPPPPPGMPPAQADPMGDTSLNPNADPEMLKQWMHDSDTNDKPYDHQDKGTVDPLSQQQEGISDTGNEQSVKVHNKKAILKQADITQGSDAEDVSPTAITPGADRSNAYPPCKYCANFNAAENSCTQGLDVEKVQAAKSCSWLNSTMSPFNGEKDPDASHKDKDTVVSDIADLPGGGGMGSARDGMVSSGSLKDYNIVMKKMLKAYLNKIWD